jgi:hypothetical protein
MYNSPLTLVLKVFKEIGKREVVGKKRSILTSLDFESRIAMHLLFLKILKIALKACSSILLV